ncbi:MAG: hypothetical protein D6784_18130 [Chloroflexi bacterium]|nr:MAG: hypothetical protein D6784_18130 [Chloroflexota bacterium]
MAFDVIRKQNYPAPAQMVSQLTGKTLESLGGKLSKRNNPAKGMFEINFNKKIKNQALPNRIDLQIKVVPQESNGCNVMARAFPVDPLGNRLTFGVKGNAAEVVMMTFFDELEKSIKE